MLKRENRIRSKKEFFEIKNKGRVLYSPLFGWLIYKENDDLKKFGFIVSKKISKKAVDRNRIRRVLSEIVRNNLDKFEKGTRLVFLTKQEILGKKMTEVKKEVEKFLK
ncbi:MAG: ribonuclease P protein component [Candidatus Shapirobacteria bacterium]|nr:ribonuclease P protein component [Candidatus Shapirobacteria bacterium]MDD4410184.1 ribonuclease P protein component [Candidatus Shapirobacteria bacterium]